MSKILCTFPGKFGDLIWALPAVRAISETIHASVDLVIAGRFASIVPLLESQPYLGRVWPLPIWEVQDTAPITPRVPPLALIAGQYDQVLHLGYRGWPQRPLPFETYDCLRDQWPALSPLLDPIDVTRPWITPPSWANQLNRQDLAVGWTDEHLELKVGVWQLVHRRAVRDLDDAFHWVDVSAGPRWLTEYHDHAARPWWETAAAWISRSAVFLGDCSALHVLACAIGTPAVLMEPAEARHHEIFWPYGRIGPQVTQVVGTDGRWTWDARHVWETIQAVATRQVATVEVSQA